MSLGALSSGAGGWRYLILVLALITLGYLLVRAMLTRQPQLPLQHWQIVTGLTAVNALLVLISLLTNPFDVLNPVGISTSVGFGSIIGIIAVLAAVAGGVMLRQAEASAGQRPTP